MATQAPPIHSFDAIKARGRVGFWKAALPKCGHPRLEIGKGQAQQFGNRSGRYHHGAVCGEGDSFCCPLLVEQIERMRQRA
jgi:hypothetical protein